MSTPYSTDTGAPGVREFQQAVCASTLPPPARHILLTLLRYCNGESLAIAAADGPSLLELSEATGLNRSTVRRHLAQLDDDGWVHRQHPDRRAARARGLVIAYTLDIPDCARLPAAAPEVRRGDTPDEGRTEQHPAGGTVRHERGADDTVRGAQDAVGGAQNTPVLKERDFLSPVRGTPAASAGDLIAKSLDLDEVDAGRVLDLIRDECRPRSELGLVRTLVANGDLANFALRVQQAASPVYAGPTHDFADPDGAGHCLTCGLPAASPRHGPDSAPGPEPRERAPVALRLVR